MNRLINAVINATWGKLSALWKGLVVVGIALLLILLAWRFATNATYSLSNWWHARQVAAAKQEIDNYKQQADAAKQIAQQALEQLEIEKKITQVERAKREAAEKVLADKTLNANQKLAAYEKAIHDPGVANPVLNDTEQLCIRAAKYGLECGN